MEICDLKGHEAELPLEAYSSGWHSISSSLHKRFEYPSIKACLDHVSVKAYTLLRLNGK